MTADRHADPVPPQPARPEAVRRSELPPTSAPEWQFHTWFPTPDGSGDLVPGQLSRGAQIRRRVTYGDWEPVHPDHWAPEPPSESASKIDAAPAAPAACTWPNCLPDAQATELSAQALAEERGEHRPPMPDQRHACGCTETPAPAPVDQTLAQRAAAALYQHEWPNAGPWNDALAMDREAFLALAHAVLAEFAPELDELRDYRNRVDWHTTCGNCARMLDAAYAETVRREQVEKRAQAIAKTAREERRRRRDAEERAEEATAALAEILAAVRTLTDADTGQPIHVPGRITDEQLTRWAALTQSREA